MTYSKGLVERSVTHNVKLESELFDKMLKLQAIIAILLVRNIVVGHLGVDKMSVPTVHIVISRETLGEARR